MNWLQLGTVEPTHFIWRYFDTPVVGSEIFRIRHHNAIVQFWGYAQLCFFYAIGDQTGQCRWKRVYPKFISNGVGTDYEIFNSPVPESIAALDISVFYAAARLPHWTPHQTPPWSFSLDVLSYNPKPDSDILRVEQKIDLLLDQQI